MSMGEPDDWTNDLDGLSGGAYDERRTPLGSVLSTVQYSRIPRSGMLRASAGAPRCPHSLAVLYRETVEIHARNLDWKRLPLVLYI